MESRKTWHLARRSQQKKRLAFEYEIWWNMWGILFCWKCELFELFCRAFREFKWERNRLLRKMLERRIWRTKKKRKPIQYSKSYRLGSKRILGFKDFVIFSHAKTRRLKVGSMLFVEILRRLLQNRLQDGFFVVFRHPIGKRPLGVGRDLTLMTVIKKWGLYLIDLFVHTLVRVRRWLASETAGSPPLPYYKCWLALFEFTNHNTRMCNVILGLVFWLVNSNNASQGFRTLI